MRTVATKHSDVNLLDFVERELLAEAVVELGGVGGLVPRDSGRDLEVAAASKVLGNPGAAEAVGADLGRKRPNANVSPTPLQRLNRRRH